MSWPEGLSQRLVEERIGELQRALALGERYLEDKRAELAWYGDGRDLGLLPTMGHDR